MAKQNLIIPSWNELIILLISSVISLGSLSLVPILNKKDPDTYKFLSDTISDRVGRVLDLFTGPRWTSILTIMLWMVVGALVYVLGWVLISIFQSYRKDVTPRNFIVPKDYKTSKNMNDKIARFLVRTLACIGLVVWIGIFFGKLLPKANGLFVRGIVHIEPFSFSRILSSLLLMVVGFYMFSILLRLVYLRRRVFA